MAMKPPSIYAGLSAELSSRNPELARALPDSKGGEVPKQLETYRTEVYTYFTTPGPTTLFYSAESWVRLKLTLETAGPVAVGQRATLDPVISGKGRLLGTNEEFEVTLAKGTRFYIASGSVNRVSVTIEPIPFLEQISHEINNVSLTVRKAAAAIVQGLGAALLKTTAAAAPAATSKSGRTQDEMPCPPPSRGLLPRLTRVLPPRKTR